MHVSGPVLRICSSRADAEFAWQGWVHCFPAGLPPILHTTDRLALLYFKSATRAFGVLSLLAAGCFTRDINTCLEVAAEFDPASANLLKALRVELEAGRPAAHDLFDLRRIMRRLYDDLAT